MKGAKYAALDLLEQCLGEDCLSQCLVEDICNFLIKAKANIIPDSTAERVMQDHKAHLKRCYDHDDNCRS